MGRRKKIFSKKLKRLKKRKRVMLCLTTMLVVEVRRLMLIGKENTRIRNLGLVGRSLQNLWEEIKLVALRLGKIDQLRHRMHRVELGQNRTRRRDLVRRLEVKIKSSNVK